MTKVAIYRNPRTSESTEEFDTFTEAVLAEPSPGADIAKNGALLARAASHGRAWHITEAGTRAVVFEADPELRARWEEFCAASQRIIAVSAKLVRIQRPEDLDSAQIASAIDECRNACQILAGLL